MPMFSIKVPIGPSFNTQRVINGKFLTQLPRFCDLDQFPGDWPFHDGRAGSWTGGCSGLCQRYHWWKTQFEQFQIPFQCGFRHVLLLCWCLQFIKDEFYFSQIPLTKMVMGTSQRMNLWKMRQKVILSKVWSLKNQHE